MAATADGVVVVSGEPAKGTVVTTPMQKSPVSAKLEMLNLEQYETELIVEQGYDDLSMLQDLTVEELEQVADDVKMKPGHKKKFVASFRADDTKASNMSSSDRSDVVPATAEPVPASAEPAVDPSMIALQQQNEKMQEQFQALKKQQSADRLEKKLEEKERLMQEKLVAQREADRKEAEMRQKLNDVQLEQMKVQMQANMNLNLATASNAAATPIVINNNNNNSGMPSAATPMPLATPVATPLPDATPRDPALLKVKLVFDELDAQDWHLMNSAGLSAMLTPHQPALMAAAKSYTDLGIYLKVIKPSFSKLAAGTSNSGTPKSPIDKSDHPDWSDPAGRDVLKGTEKSSPAFTWDHPAWTALGMYPYFKEQPTFKNVFTMAAEIKAGKLTKMNKAGKAALGTQFLVAVAEAEQRLSSAEEKELIVELEGKMKNWLEQLEKMRLEEKQNDACCCTIM